MFRILGAGGHLIGSWDLLKHKHTPKLQKWLYQNLPELRKPTRELLHSCFTLKEPTHELLHTCCRSEHLVESRSTDETFLVKWYKKTAEIIDGIAKMKTEVLMVFTLDEEGNAVYTEDIGDLAIFLSNSEPFCVPASSFPGMLSNHVYIFDYHEAGVVDLAECFYVGENSKFGFGALTMFHLKI